MVHIWGLAETWAPGKKGCERTLQGCLHKSQLPLGLHPWVAADCMCRLELLGGLYASTSSFNGQYLSGSLRTKCQAPSEMNRTKSLLPKGKQSEEREFERERESVQKNHLLSVNYMSDTITGITYLNFNPHKNPKV